MALLLRLEDLKPTKECTPTWQTTGKKRAAHELVYIFYSALICSDNYCKNGGSKS